MANFEFIRKAYGVPAEYGRRVTVGGRGGFIVEDMGSYIGITFDDQKVTQINPHHPTADGIVYGELGTPRRMTRGQREYRRWQRSESSLSFIDCMREWRRLKVAS